jgi:hypothetical protein
MKADELLISAEELPWREFDFLAGHGSMSDLAIMHKSRDTLGCDYSANCMMSPLIVPIDHLPRNSRKSLITWLIFTFCPISVLASVRDPNRSLSALYRRLESA